MYNSISLADYQIGKILQRLKKDNLMDSTIIILYADHGEAMPRGKTNGIDLGYRVPFILYIAPMYSSLSPRDKHAKEVLMRDIQTSHTHCYKQKYYIRYRI
ncbi:sulfatase-like hydrolase/transferase [Flavobacterium sp. FlaQc-48]|uniref:sulfatase-like hydrolase/transferase n=1 Tax=Flavobacterium sp. FlaQc-48 TaxID=3374181 RepID=UPI003756A037